MTKHNQGGLTMGNTMFANDLHRILSDAKQFRSNDSTFPTLGVVRLEVNDNNLLAVATDRYALGVSRADYQGEPFTANLSKSSVDNLLRIAKTAKAIAGSRMVDIDSAGDNTVHFAFSTGETLTVQREDYDFPRWQQLIPEDPIEREALGLVSVAGYNATNIARLAKVHGSEYMRLWSRGSGKPTVATIGNDFVALIMQTRVDEEVRFVKPSWMGV